MQIFRSVAIFLAAFIFASCDNSGVKVYHVEKEDTAVPPSMATESAAPDQNENASALPQLQWSLPPGWTEETPGQMRVASFSATGADGQTADIGVIPLPVTGQEIQLVNMWRDQLKMPTTTNTESEAVNVGGEIGKLFDLVSQAPLVDGKFPTRILVAMLTRGETSWFFKMTGADPTVAAQRKNFLAFLKSISFASATTQTATAAATENSNNSIWQIPANWKALPPSEFLLAEFSIETNGASADVNVAELNGDGGGLQANVNRWRGQLGLQPIAELLTTPLSSTDTSGAQVVDFSGTNSKTGKPARLVGAIVPQNGQTWFYKLMGDDSIVASQKDAFLKFIQSAKYPDAR